MEHVATTTGAPGFVDLTPEIEATLARSGIVEGQVTVFAGGDGCSLFVNERESGLLCDLEAAFRRLQLTTAAERGAVIGSSSVVLPASRGRLRLGAWQRVFMVELDSPGSRRIVMQIVGE